MHTWDQLIPYAGCVTQMYFFIFFGCVDNLLAVMACHPLHYTTIMWGNLCISLVAVSWIFSCSNAMSHTLSLAWLSFCADNTIPHFFCDLAALLAPLLRHLPQWVGHLHCGGTGNHHTTNWHPSLMSTLGSPSWESPQPKGFTKPCPPVAPTALWFSYSMGQLWFCTFSHHQTTPMTKT